MSDLPTKHENYSSWQLNGGENDTIFSTPSEFKGEGPTKENTEGEGAANYAGRSATRKAYMNGEYDSNGNYKGRK